MKEHSLEERQLIRRLTETKGREKAQAYWPVSRGSAAVLIPLVPESGDAQGSGALHYDVLFEIRSRNIAQGGEICFPGGSMEDGETPEICAGRETGEELLLPKEDIRILTPLCSIFGPGGRKVTAVLGLLSHYAGTYSEDEVASVFRLPLSYFLENRPQRYYGAMVAKLPEDFPYELIPGGRAYKWKEIPRTFYFYQTPYGVIWGMTAELCALFSESLRAAAGIQEPDTKA